VQRAIVGALGLTLGCAGPGLDRLDDDAVSTSDPDGTQSGTQSDTGSSDTGSSG